MILTLNYEERKILNRTACYDQDAENVMIEKYILQPITNRALLYLFINCLLIIRDNICSARLGKRFIQHQQV